MAAAALDSGMKPLQKAMKLASVAIQLDAGNKHEEANLEYLRSINYISQALLEDAAAQKSEMVPVEVQKMLRLAEQCLERVKSFAGKRVERSSAEVTRATLSASSGTAASAPPEKTAPHGASTASLEPPTRHRRVLSEGRGNASPFLPPEIFQKLQTAELQETKKELTPIEEASRLNQKLRANFEVRLARLPPGQATQKTSLTLSLQRQMMENLIIAKARQDALHRKMEERRLRLQEEANRRFASSGAATPEEQEQRVLYASILEYEQDHDWPKLWKARLKKNPNDFSQVSGLVSHLLSCPEHPIVKLLKNLQYRIYDRLYPLVSRCPAADSPLAMKSSLSAHNLQTESYSFPPAAAAQSRAGHTHSLSTSLSPSLAPYHDHNANREEGPLGEAPSLDREDSFEDLEQFINLLSPGCDPKLEVESYILDLEERALKDHLAAIVKDIHNAIDRLSSLCLLSFECLNTAVAKDQCVASLEEAFFPPLWSPLLALFRKVHRERELSYETSVRLFRNTTPSDIGVASKLFPKETSEHGCYPYESAVMELRLICKELCPQRKLDCIVRTLRLICACAEEYRSFHDPESPPKTAAIGADDLLPILSYVALRTELPQLVSECAALEEFIHEGYLIGEEGYCLTSLQTELHFHLITEDVAVPTGTCVRTPRCCKMVSETTRLARVRGEARLGKWRSGGGISLSVRQDRRCR
ncbi:VPS9 domain-containing protein 1 isoform X1 [Arapaima gigas]